MKNKLFSFFGLLVLAPVLTTSCQGPTPTPAPAPPPPTAAPCPSTSVGFNVGANSREAVGTRVDGTITCSPPTPPTPAANTTVTITYPSGLVATATTDAAGRFTNVQPVAFSGSVVVSVTGSNGVATTRTVAILTGGP